MSNVSKIINIPISIRDYDKRGKQNYKISAKDCIYIDMVDI